MEAFTPSTVGAGGHLSRRPLDGPEARRLSALSPALVLVYEGGGTWAMCERRRRPRRTAHFVRLGGDVGRLVVMEDAYTLVKRFDRLDGGEIENEARRLLWLSRNDLVFDEVDRHNERLLESKRRDWRNETSSRFAYGRDMALGVRHFGLDGFGAGIGGAARVA